MSDKLNLIKPNSYVVSGEVNLDHIFNNIDGFNDVVDIDVYNNNGNIKMFNIHGNIKNSEELIDNTATKLENLMITKDSMTIDNRDPYKRKELTIYNKEKVKESGNVINTIKSVYDTLVTHDIKKIQYDSNSGLIYLDKDGNNIKDKMKLDGSIRFNNNTTYDITYNSSKYTNNKEIKIDYSSGASITYDGTTYMRVGDSFIAGNYTWKITNNADYSQTLVCYLTTDANESIIIKFIHGGMSIDYIYYFNRDTLKETDIGYNYCYCHYSDSVEYNENNKFRINPYRYDMIDNIINGCIIRILLTTSGGKILYLEDQNNLGTDLLNNYNDFLFNPEKWNTNTYDNKYNPNNCVVKYNLENVNITNYPIDKNDITTTIDGAPLVHSV